MILLYVLFVKYSVQVNELSFRQFSYATVEDLEKLSYVEEELRTI